MSLEISHRLRQNQIPFIMAIADSFDSNCLQATCNHTDVKLGYVIGKFFLSYDLPLDLYERCTDKVIDNSMKWIGLSRSFPKCKEYDDILSQLATKILDNADLGSLPQPFSEVPMSKRLWNTIFTLGYRGADIEKKEKMIALAKKLDTSITLEKWELTRLKTSYYISKCFESQWFQLIVGCIVAHLSIKCILYICSIDPDIELIRTAYKRYYLIFYACIGSYMVLKSINPRFAHYADRFERVLFPLSHNHQNARNGYWALAVFVRAIALASMHYTRLGSRHLSNFLHTQLNDRLDTSGRKAKIVWESLYDSSLKA